MPRLLITLLSLLVFTKIHAQEIDSTRSIEAKPKSDFSGIITNIRKLKFSENTLTTLSEKQVVYVYSVDKYGSGQLAYLIGIDEGTLKDSLLSCAPQNKNFYPALTDSVPVASNYYVNVYFDRILGPFRFINHQKFMAGRFKREDFKILNISNKSLEIVLAGLTHVLQGPIAHNFGNGGGFSMEFNFFGSSGYGGGFQMTILGGKLRKPIEIPDTREQNQAPPIGLFGVNFGKIVRQSLKSELNVQLQLNYTFLNLISSEDPETEKAVQYKGISTGVVSHYYLKLGGGKSGSYYTSPRWIESSIDIQAGMHYSNISLEHIKTSGLVFTLGVGYKFRARSVINYQLTDEAFNRYL